jgi:hypothetical protein
VGALSAILYMCFFIVMDSMGLLLVGILFRHLAIIYYFYCLPNVVEKGVVSTDRPLSYNPYQQTDYPDLNAKRITIYLALLVWGWGISEQLSFRELHAIRK